jgi:hypothetical protein
MACRVFNTLDSSDLAAAGASSASFFFACPFPLASVDVAWPLAPLASGVPSAGDGLEPSSPAVAVSASFDFSAPLTSFRRSAFSKINAESWVLSGWAMLVME